VIVIKTINKRNVNKKGKARIRGKKRVIFILALAAMAILAVSMVLYVEKPKIGGSSIVATFNGEPITFNEFKQNIASKRAEVSGYFQSKYKSNAGNKFWTTNFNGEVPLDKIKKAALASSVEIKIPQILAKKKGIVSDITYETFLKGLDAENKRRANADKNKQVIYGPVHFGEAEYYGLMNSNRVGEIKQAFEKNTNFSDEELNRYYETNKELYKQEDSIQIKKISVSGADAAKIINDIKANMDTGMNFEKAITNYKEQVKIENQVFDSTTAHSDTLGYPVLFSKVLPLEKGQITEVFQESGAYLIAECIDREYGRYRAFGDVKEAIRSYLAGKAYDQAVDNMSRDVKVVINSKVYNRIGVKEVNEQG
jgi:hypothetical protein